MFRLFFKELRMSIFKNTDKKFEKIGFIKIKEDEYGVSYERLNEEFHYIQRIDILHKTNGKHIVQSYDASNTTSRYSPVVGLTGYEVKLVLKKMKEIKLYNK